VFRRTEKRVLFWYWGVKEARLGGVGKGKLVLGVWKRMVRSEADEEGVDREESDEADSKEDEPPLRGAI
jgi:hypothetical protein